MKLSNFLSNRVSTFPNSSNIKAEKDKLNLSKELKTLLIEWASNSTSHGIPNIAKTDRIYLKILWLIFFLLSSSFCFYLIIKCLIEYSQYPVLTNIQLITETPTQFPAITICNLNTLKTFNSSIYNQLAVLENKSSIYLKKFNSLVYTRFVLRTVKAYMKHLDLEQKKSYGIDLEEMLMSCRYNGENCNKYDFKWFFSYDYGNCYTFNFNQSNLKYVGKNGVRNGLILELYIGNSSLDEIGVIEKGIKVIVHNQSVTPMPLDEGLDVSPGSTTNIAISRVYLNKLSNPYSSCLNDLSANTNNPSDLMKIIFFKLNQTEYRQKLCEAMCYQNNVIKKCNCYDTALFNPFGNQSGCFEENDLVCQEDTFKLFYQYPLDDSCTNQCPVGNSNIIKFCLKIIRKDFSR